MEYKDILYEKTDEVIRLTMNRPEKLNALSFEMLDEMVDALHRAEDDDDVKVIILKGNGTSFSSGIDLTQVGYIYGFGDGKTPEGRRRPSQRARLKFDRHMLECFQAFLYSIKPIISQVHGYCIGGGANLVEASDLAICAEDAKIGHPEQRFGFGGSTFMLNLEMILIGPKKAREMALLGELIDGKEAERIGYVNKAVPLDKLEEEIEKWAKKVCLIPKDGIIIGKAFNQLALDSLGMTSQFIQGYIGHTMGTNLRFEANEFNFFKERRDKGSKAAVHERDERFSKIK